MRAKPWERTWKVVKDEQAEPQESEKTAYPKLKIRADT
jgi:hypothetical protein